MDIVVVSDTHLRGGLRSRLSDAAMAAISSADVVLHAGDVVSATALTELRSLVQAYVVLGNNDTELVGILPETLVVELEGLRVAMVHDSGPASGRGARLAARFPDASVVVFGHSHIPWHEEVPGGPVIVNPGSATERRAQPQRTIGRMRILDGVLEHWSLERV